MSQFTTFSQRVNQLFFGVDVTQQSNSLIDSLRSIHQLHYKDYNARNWEFWENAWTATPEFTFTGSPLPDLKIEAGTIGVKLGWIDTDSIAKVLELNWDVRFSKNAEAKKCFEKLQQLFGDVVTYKKFEHDKKEGDAAYFLNYNPGDNTGQYVSLFLYRSLITKKYEISLKFGNEFMDE